MTTDTVPQTVLFPDLFDKPLFAQFNQEQASSDGGAILLKAAERIYGLVKAFAGCLFDKRAPDKTRHSLADLIGQRIFGIACGIPTAMMATVSPPTPSTSCCSTETRFRASAWRRSRRCRGSRTQSTAARSTAWRTSWPRGVRRQLLWPLVLPHLRMLPACLKTIEPMVFRLGAASCPT